MALDRDVKRLVGNHGLEPQARGAGVMQITRVPHPFRDELPLLRDSRGIMKGGSRFTEIPHAYTARRFTSS